MSMILVLSYLSYVKKRDARNPVGYAAKPLKLFSQAKKNTLNFANRAVENAVNLGDLKDSNA